MNLFPSYQNCYYKNIDVFPNSTTYLRHSFTIIVHRTAMKGEELLEDFTFIIKTKGTDRKLQLLSFLMSHHLLFESLYNNTTSIFLTDKWRGLLKYMFASY